MQQFHIKTEPTKKYKMDMAMAMAMKLNMQLVHDLMVIPIS